MLSSHRRSLLIGMPPKVGQSRRLWNPSTASPTSPYVATQDSTTLTNAGTTRSRPASPTPGEHNCYTRELDGSCWARADGLAEIPP